MDKGPAGVVILALCVLMRRGCVPAARVITALLPPPPSPTRVKLAQYWLKSVISFCRLFGWHPLNSLSCFPQRRCGSQQTLRIVMFRGVCVLRLLPRLFHQAQMCISMRVLVRCRSLFVCLIPIMLVTSVLKGKTRKKGVDFKPFPY